MMRYICSTDNIVGITYLQLIRWYIKLLCHVFPIPFLKYIVEKADSTLALSNFPGTQALTIIGGHRLEDFLFWIPNKCKVGEIHDCLYN